MSHNFVANIWYSSWAKSQVSGRRLEGIRKAGSFSRQRNPAGVGVVELARSAGHSTEPGECQKLSLRICLGPNLGRRLSRATAA